MSRVTRRQIANIIDSFDGYASTSHYCPSKDMIGWKVVFMPKFNSEPGLKYITHYTPILAKLRIPHSAHRTKYNDPLKERYAKHRCELVEVIGYYSYYTGKEIKQLIAPPMSFEDPRFRYPSALPEYVIPDYYDSSLRICSHGIHFFYEKQSALIWGDMLCCNNEILLRKQAFVLESWKE